jgi:DNA helicase-4
MLEVDDAPTRNSQGFLDVEIFKDLYQKNKDFYEGVINYFSGYLKPYIPQYAFETKKEWEEYVAELGDLYTLSSHKVKSREEKVIANFLFRKGVSFEYERPYEIPTETPECKRRSKSVTV